MKLLDKANRWLESWRRGFMVNEIAVTYGFTVRDSHRICRYAKWDRKGALAVAVFLRERGLEVEALDEIAGAVRAAMRVT